MIDFCVAVHIAEVSEKATFLLLCVGKKRCVWHAASYAPYSGAVA